MSEHTFARLNFGHEFYSLVPFEDVCERPEFHISLAKPDVEGEVEHLSSAYARRRVLEAEALEIASAEARTTVQ